MLPVSHTLCLSTVRDGQKGKDSKDTRHAGSTRKAAGWGEGGYFSQTLQLRLAGLSQHAIV